MRLDLVNWAAREIEVQGDSYKDIISLVDAFLYLEEWVPVRLTPSIIIEAGFIAKPIFNTPSHFRRTNVLVGNHTPPDWQNVDRLIEQLCDAWQGWRHGEMTPAEFFIEFEKIHPFRDGNGRIGAAIWNILENRSDDELLLSYEIFNDWDNV